MEKLLTTNDLAKRWQCSVETVLRHTKKGLKVISLGSKDYRYSIQDILEYEEYLKSANEIDTASLRFKSNKFKMPILKNDFKLV